MRYGTNVYTKLVIEEKMTKHIKIYMIEEATTQDPRIKELINKLGDNLSLLLWGIQLHEGVITMIWKTRNVKIPTELLNKQFGGLPLDWDVCPIHHNFLAREEYS
jgi:hypothetical protein